MAFKTPQQIDESKKPPVLQEGYTRIKYSNIMAETTKATLFKLEDKTVWIPRSCYTVHLAQGILDIKNSFYDQNINT